jgi:hypothetical protein
MSGTPAWKANDAPPRLKLCPETSAGAVPINVAMFFAAEVLVEHWLPATVRQERECLTQTEPLVVQPIDAHVILPRMHRV